MSVPTTNNFARLLDEKQRRENRYISLLEVSRETKIPRKTLYKWARNEVSQYDTSVIDKLAKYFELSEIGDLLEFSEKPESPKKK
jgi:transcriptional regulator with XRE-family HTH domain